MGVSNLERLGTGKGPGRAQGHRASGPGNSRHSVNVRCVVMRADRVREIGSSGAWPLV